MGVFGRGGAWLGEGGWGSRPWGRQLGAGTCGHGLRAGTGSAGGMGRGKAACIYGWKPLPGLLRAQKSAGLAALARAPHAHAAGRPLLRAGCSRRSAQLATPRPHLRPPRRRPVDLPRLVCCLDGLAPRVHRLGLGLHIRLPLARLLLGLLLKRPAAEGPGAVRGCIRRGHGVEQGNVCMCVVLRACMRACVVGVGALPGRLHVL